MQILERKLDDLILDPDNARTHDEKNLAAIKGSLAKFGQQHPIIVDANGLILAGNGRYRAMRELGWETVYVVESDLATVTEKMAFALADNRTAELADWDDAVLKETLMALKADEFDLDAIGFDPGEFDLEPPKDGLSDPDEVPETSENEFGVKRGDIWQLGEHRLMCGDSTNKEDVDLLMDGAKADMVFTDPPYGINVVQDNGHTRHAHKSNKAAQGQYKKIENDDVILDLSCLFDIGENVFIFGGNYFAHKLPRSTHWIVWNKHGKQDLERQYAGSDAELVWTNLDKKSVTVYTHAWAGMFRSGAKKDELSKRVHPTQKPVTLLANILDDHEKYATVVDPFLGSGSTLIACEKTNRKCYGMEIDPYYCSVIIKRWQQYTDQKATLIS